MSLGLDRTVLPAVSPGGVPVRERPVVSMELDHRAASMAGGLLARKVCVERMSQTE
ncbi:MAG: hypothetical protein LBV00_04170 [Propionibacteriaceae bacterium]|nr:hypothetical protein [Propionibacteriaceae bacterium]